MRKRDSRVQEFCILKVKNVEKFLDFQIMLISLQSEIKTATSYAEGFDL